MKSDSNGMCVQGVYYYFYQVFRNQAEKLALRRKKRGKGDGTVGMFGSLVVAALAGYVERCLQFHNLLVKFSFELRFSFCFIGISLTGL